MRRLILLLSPISLLACYSAYAQGSAQPPAPGAASDILSEPGIHLTPALRERIATRLYRSVLCVPLVARDRVVGALSISGPVFRMDLARARALLPELKARCNEISAAVKAG